MLLFDSDGKERVRLEGYMTNADFTAALMNGLGRLAFVRKRFQDAERWFDDVVTRFGDSHVAPAAMYWRGVSRYSATHDHTALAKAAEDLKATYPSSLWASKATPWLPTG